MAAVNVSTVEEENFLAELEVDHADRDEDDDDDDDEDEDDEGLPRATFKTIYADFDPDPDSSPATDRAAPRSESARSLSG